MKAAHDIVRHLILSEKVSKGMERLNRYCFKVDPAANKLEIKRAVEELFKVGVVRVNTLHRRGKLKRERTWKYGLTTGAKRAYVTLKAGDKIEVV